MHARGQEGRRTFPHLFLTECTVLLLGAPSLCIGFSWHRTLVRARLRPPLHHARATRGAHAQPAPLAILPPHAPRHRSTGATVSQLAATTSQRSGWWRRCCARCLAARPRRAQGAPAAQGLVPRAQGPQAQRRPAQTLRIARKVARVLPGGAFADLRACASPAVAGEYRSATAEGRARPTARLGAARNVLASCELLFYSAVAKLLGLSTVSSYRALVDNLVPDPSERFALVLALGLTPIFIIVVLAAFTAVICAVRRTRQEEDRLRPFIRHHHTRCVLERQQPVPLPAGRNVLPVKAAPPAASERSGRRRVVVIRTGAAMSGLRLRRGAAPERRCHDGEEGERRCGQRRAERRQHG